MIKSIFDENNDSITFSIHLIPGAKREAFLDIIQLKEGYALKLSIHAKPTDNQANDALIKFLSNKFKIAKSNIIIKRGEKSRNKCILIQGYSISRIPNQTVMEIINLFKGA